MRSSIISSSHLGFSGRTSALLCAALSCVLLTSACAKGFLSEEDEAHDEDGEVVRKMASGLSCGTERWSVKTGTDPDAHLINQSPQDSTIQALGALAAPISPPLNARVAPEEEQVYRLTNVTLVEYKQENDSDFHLVLHDAAGHSMIGEIPAPGCVGTGSAVATGIQTARNAFLAHHTPSGSFQQANETVSLIGVAFFDFDHGQTGKAPNVIELHPVTGICFGQNCAVGGGGGQNDFAVNVTPASQSVASGASASFQVATSVTAGSAQTLSLSVTGLPPGATGSFGPATVNAGATSILTVAVPAGDAPATFTLSITGAAGTVRHTAQVQLQVTGAGGGGGGGGGGGDAVVNGGFETGSVSGWTGSGHYVGVVKGGHAGTYAAQIGDGKAFNGDSTLTQAVQVPTGGQLSFWYRPHCPDTLQYDQIRAEVRDAGGNTLVKLLDVCADSTAWTQVTQDLSAYAGQTVTLWFDAHDDGYTGDATDFAIDEVSVTGTGGGGGGGGGGPVLANGGFETGDTTGWTGAGVTGVVGTAHGGRHAAQVGDPANPSKDSSLTQGFTVPAGSPSLSFWYQVHCKDTVKYSWATVTLEDASGKVLATPLANTCTQDTTWHEATEDLSAWAGKPVTLVLAAHSDGYAGYTIAALYDDVSVTGGSGGGGGGGGGDTTPPVVSLSAPADGATVSGTASLTASASDNVGVTRVDFLVDGTVVGSASAAPWQASWDTTAVADGAHTVSARAADAAGNTGTSAVAHVTVHNGGGGTGGHVHTVFVIVMENHNWTAIKGSASAPYINNTLLPMASHAEHYQNAPGIHPSEPNYLWMEAGTNFGVTNDNNPSSNHQSSTQHLVTLLQNAGYTWKSYAEGVTGTKCPLTNSGLYAPKHVPFLYFDDVTNTLSSTSQNCIDHVRPFTELATDLQNNTVANYNFITPNLCDDMHNSSGCATSDSVKNGDTWLSQTVPMILNSQAYQNGGALFITWDESESGDHPIGMIVLSPFAKGGGYSNAISYTHSSLLRTNEEIFHLTPYLGDAANATDLSDLFQSFP